MLLYDVIIFTVLQQPHNKQLMNPDKKSEKPPISARRDDGQKTPLLPALLDEVQAFCKARRGRVVELAAVLDVAQPQLSAWLTRKLEPAGEVTLQMQDWLRREREAEKSELAAKIEAAPSRLGTALKMSK